MGDLNFPAHAHVVRLAIGEDPALLFGAMLPDLVNMAGERFQLDLPDEVEAGRRLHHRADECFHDTAAFRDGVGRLRAALRAQGLGSGPSRAGAHLGYELVLDTCLPWDEALASDLTRALAFGAELATRLSARPRAAWVPVLNRFAAVRWIGLASTTDEELAHRVEGILSRRPRLALPPGGCDSVATALTAVRPTIADTSEELFAEVAVALATSPAREPSRPSC
ncbi:MAG TPA: hypothetical protein VGH94_01875 [Acidimicrobiales bacterium]